MPFSTTPELFQVLRGYAALVPPKHLQFPAHLEAQVINTFLVDHILTNPHFERYPPSKQYQKTFWKWTIDHLEKMPVDPEEFEVDSQIYDHYLELINTSSGGPSLTGSSPPSQSYVTHFWKPPNGPDTYQTTTLLESRTVIESGTTGLRTWLASLVLAQYLITHASFVRGKRILELGSGIGFLGSIVASLQLLDGNSTPGTLHLSDVNDSVIERCRDNIQLHCNSSSTHPAIKFCFLDWSAALDPDGITPLTSLLHEELDAELILGADVVFDPDLIPALVAVLRLALQSRSDSHTKCALIALTVRNPSTMAKFVDTVRDNHLSLETLDLPMEDRIFMEPIEGGDANNGVDVFRITAH